MRHKVIIKDASVKSLNKGAIVVDSPMGQVEFKNVSLISLIDGTVELLVDRELRMDDLITGMVVQYDCGVFRLVIRISDELVKLVELKGGGYGYISRATSSLLRSIVRVWEPITVGSLDEWMEISATRKVIFER